VLRRDGRYRWFLIRYSPLLDEQGRIERWYLAAFDIEDRKGIEAQVQQAYLRLAEAQRLSKTGSFITDLVADEHSWSEEAFRIFRARSHDQDHGEHDSGHGPSRKTGTHSTP
jgi:PAS domain-containing protein